MTIRAPFCALQVAASEEQFLDALARIERETREGCAPPHAKVDVIKFGLMKKKNSKEAWTPEVAAR